MTLPSLANSPTKEKIINIISANWPITAKGIHRILKKDDNISITYQAIHKALKELIQNDILEKDNSGYALNRKWVKELGEFTQKVEEEFEGRKNKSEIKTFKKIVFENHSKYIKFTIDFMEELIRKEKKLNVTFYFRHVPYPNVLSKEDVLKLRPIMRRIKWTINSHESTELDEWHAKLWRRFGIKVKTGTGLLADRLAIMNDYIINAYVAEKLNKGWDNSYNVKNISDFDMTGIMEAINSPRSKTIAIIFQDAELAKMLRK